MDLSMNVLIVDDFSTMRKILRNILKDMGFKNILEADDGSTALDVLHNNDIDLIISDWNMPKMKGIELLQKVREDPKYKDLPFLMVTAEAQKQNIVDAVKLGVTNYVVKPFTPDTISEKLNSMFH